MRRRGTLITKLNKDSFIFNNKVFSLEPDSLEFKTGFIREEQLVKVIDLIKDAHKQPEFKELFKVFDKLKELEGIKRPHPLTGKSKTPLITLLKEADNIAYPGRKDAFSKTGLSLDHFSKGLAKPFEGLRVSTRSLNEAAGQLYKRHF